MSKKKKKVRPAPESLGFPCTGVESHAHIDLQDFNEDRDEVIARATASGVAWIGNVFLGPEAYRKNVYLFDNHPNVFFLVGVHPNDADRLTPQDIEAMREIAQNDNRVKAIGEIGLDYYWERVDHDIQKQAFRAQLKLAQELGLPPVIHSRDAHEDAVALLEEMGFKGKPLLWHCFGGAPNFARQLLNNGWHISIPGPVTYKKNEELREAVIHAGIDKLLVETDCPYLTPEPWRGKRNEPALSVFTAQRIAELLEMEPEEAWTRLGQNAIAFFGLE